MFKNNLIALVLGLFFLSGCGYKESIVQNNDVGYLEFSRTTFEALSIHINDSRHIPLERCNPEENCNKNIRYEVPSGSLHIKVFDKEDRQIYQEKFYLGVGNVKKVVLP
ncbi:MAG TPA: hypothetical protein ENN33_02180 [Ignavibacteria bacterium]|nr:hypothetical protein [Ignavibacteria bacterium]